MTNGTSAKRPSEEELLSTIPHFQILQAFFDSLPPIVDDDQLQHLKSTFEALQQELDAMFAKRFLGPLADRQTWHSLSAEPAHFNKQLDTQLTGIRRFMRARHGVASNRPIKNAKRDGKLSVYRATHKDLSFGQIGRKFGLKANVVQRACERFDERCERMVDSCRWLIAFFERYSELCASFQPQPTLHLPHKR